MTTITVTEDLSTAEYHELAMTHQLQWGYDGGFVTATILDAVPTADDYVTCTMLCTLN